MFDMKITTNRLAKLLDEPNLTVLIVTETLFLSMVANNPVELGSEGVGVVFLHITAICLLQMAMLATFHRHVRARGAAAVYFQQFVFAAFLVFNIYTVLLIHIPSDSGAYAYKGIIPVVLLLMIPLILSVKPWKFINVSGLAFGMIVSVQFLLNEFTSEIENVAMPKMAENATFERHPNVYFLSFDALVPTDIVEFFLHQPNTKYSDFLNKHDFREVENAFATSDSTSDSLSAVVAVDTKFCDELGKGCWELVIGKIPSPLYRGLQRRVDISSRTLYISMC